MLFRPFLLIVVLFIVACDEPIPQCTANPQAFQQQYEPTSTAYQNAVLEILRDKTPEDFGYVFETFIEGDPVYMMTSFRNPEYCFSVKVLVDKWDKLGGMRKVNGRKYPNGLVNLKWTIEDINGQPTVVYQDMRIIID
jgi:hypothetical protein